MSTFSNNFSHILDTVPAPYSTIEFAKCNMFIPYYKEKFHYSFEELRNNIDLFFERIDYAAYFGLIGGEPMLNPVLKDVIVYLEENYRDKFGKISYASNGSVMPTDALFRTPRHITIIKLPIIQPIPFRPAACQMLLQLLCITFHRMAGKSKIAPDQRGLYIIINMVGLYCARGH